LGIRAVCAGDVSTRLRRAGSVFVEVWNLGGDGLREARDRGEVRLVEAGAGDAFAHRGSAERGDLVVRGTEGEAHAAHSGGFPLNTAEIRFKCQWSVVGFIACS